MSLNISMYPSLNVAIGSFKQKFGKFGKGNPRERIWLMCGINTLDIQYSAIFPTRYDGNPETAK